MSSNTRNSNIGLPKLNIKKFNGDAMEWQCFYDSFIEAIHININLSDIEEINYLLSLLSGEAETTIKGLQLKKRKLFCCFGFIKNMFW